MRLSLIQMSSGAGDSAANVAKACDFIDLAARDRPDLIVTPEYFNTGYFPMYRDVRNYARAERDDGPSMRAVKDKARQHKTHIAATLIEEEALGLFFNTTMLVDPDGEIVGKYRKMHPPAQHSLEKIYYRYGANFRVFPVAGFNVSFLICFDFGFPETSRCAMLNGAELIVAPYCDVAYYTSPLATNRPAEVEDGSLRRGFESGQRRLLWNAQAMVRASENACYVAPCNHGGEEFDSYMSGGSLICDPTGRIIVQAEEDETVIHADLDREVLLKARVNSGLKDRRPDLYGTVVKPMEDQHLP